MSTYSKANKTAQWFEDNYGGSRMHLTAATMVLCLHTTEGFTWPSYSGGAIAPNYTAHPVISKKRIDWRAHFNDETSSRALENHAGGVETNTLNVVQLELVGTCDPAHTHTWDGKRAGHDYIYWPDAPDWALQQIANFIKDMHKRHGLKLSALDFQAYPGSYGERGKTNHVRMSGAQWRNFAGICGHQHVPENDHGDPGAFPIKKVLDMVDPKKNAAPAPAKTTRITKAHDKGDELLKLLDGAVKHGRTGTVKSVRDEIRRQLDRLPRE